MDIAVCDDSMEALNDVRNVLIETNRVNLIECFNDIDRFMRDVEDGSRYDIVMMDIDWKEKKNGIDYAAWLYDKAPDTRLIFFTGYSQEYIEDVFMQRTNIEGYLKKPVKKDRVIKIIDKIENSKRNMNLQKLVIKQRGQIQTVAYESIIYIEGSNHNVYIYTDKKDIMVYDSLQQILKQLPDDFYQCHRSFIINFNHVKRIEKEYVVMDNGEHVSVSRLKRKELSDLFFKYMGKKM